MFNRLFYTGPSIEVLHEHYAKKGLIDEEAFVKASHELRIESPVERVWQLISDAPGWERLNPDIHDVQVGSAVAPDARFTWVSGKARIQSRFAVVDPEREFTWTGVSLEAKAVHRNTLEPTLDGATRVRSEESMAGPLLAVFFNNSKLKDVLEKWLMSLKTAAEQRS